MEATPQIRAVLADDHVVVRHGLRMLLSMAEGIEVVAEAGDGDAALEQALAERPAVLVLDLNMPGRPAEEVIAALGEQAPEVGVLVLTMESDPEFARRCLAGGARGYLLKKAVEEEFVEAVRVVAGGGSYTGAEVQAALSSRRADDSPSSLLTDREIEVLRLSALGHTNPEIASQLGLSVRTVESHRTRIFQKAPIETRPDLVRYAIDHHLI